MNAVDNYGIYRKLEWDKIKDDILKLADPKNVTRSLLTELFSRGAQTQDEDGNITMSPAKYNVTDYFDLPANILINQTKAVKDTTIGVFILTVLSLHSQSGIQFRVIFWFRSLFPQFLSLRLLSTEAKKACSKCISLLRIRFSGKGVRAALLILNR